jgi:hypothetical protein
MQDYKKFIEEITSLSVKTVDLLTEPIKHTLPEGQLPISDTEIFPLSCIDTRNLTDQEKLEEEKNGAFKKYWDLSHYASTWENPFEHEYELKLKNMIEMAFLDLTFELEKMKSQKKVISDLISKFNNFKVKFFDDKMVLFCNQSPYFLNTKFYQDDLKIYYLSLLNVSGIDKNYDGVSPDFIDQLYRICMTKKAALESINRKIKNYFFHVQKINEKPKKKILCWEDLIRVGLHAHLKEIESKIEGKISNWKQRIDLIECAAFCHLLYRKFFFEETFKLAENVNRIAINAFAQSKYGIDISVQLGSTKNKDRSKQEILLSWYFK